MSKFQSKKLGSQPLLWKQAVTDSDNRGWNFTNIFLYPLKKYKYKYKNTPSILVDNFIIGSNPLINLLLLEKFSKQAVRTRTNIKVAIMTTEQPDYWGYEIINDADFWIKLSKKRGQKITTIEGFFDDICKNISKDNLEVLHIKENQHNIKYSKFDKYISGWIFHLFNKPEQKLELDDYVVVQNDIKSLIAKSFIKTLKKYNLLNYVNWVNITTENQPVILTKNTFLTTLPQGWITSLHNGDYLDVDLVRFENKLTSTSYGSAKHIMTNKIKAISLAKEDVLLF